MGRRRVSAVVAAVALLVGAACSDDDSGDASSTTRARSATTATTAAGGLVQVELEGRPSAVALAEGRLWVASDAETTGGRGTVAVHDPRTGELVASTPLGAPPVAFAPVEDGVWAVGASGLLTKLGSDGAAIARTAQVSLGNGLVDALVAAGRLWVADVQHGVVNVLDPENGEVVADPIPIAAGAVRLASDGGRVWVSGREDQVTPIDTATLVARQPVRVGLAPIGMAVVQDVLWVTNSEDDTVARVSLESGQPVGEPLAVGDAPIAVAADGDDVWVLAQDGATLHRLDAATGEPIGAPVELPMRPRGMAIADGGVWVVGVDPSLAVLVPSQ